MALSRERRIILTHQQSVKRVRDSVTDWVTRYWGSMDSWRDADIERMVAKIVPVIESGQRAVYRLTDAYLTTIAMELGDAVPRIASAAPSVAFRGVAATEVYLRPGSTVYAALSEGKTLDEAVALGLKRLRSLVETDMQLAMTNSARDFFGRSERVVGYRRTLTGAENCALCALASTQRYHKGNLMPIHPGCDCGVAPIYGDSDPGQVINEDLLRESDALMRSVGVSDTHAWSGKQYKTYQENRDAARVMIRDHGEYGPTLTWRDQEFTGPADI